MSVRKASAALLLLGSALPAFAQDTSQSPMYGSVSLTSGFTPDPHTRQVTAGGTNAASNLGGECDGFVATAPDYRLNFTAGDLPLIISATSDGDTTLVINDPGGDWYCDDDSGGDLNPLVRFGDPQSGQYDIWIGVYDEDERPDATIRISELEDDDSSDGGAADYNADPNYETVTLSSGFTPDPHSISLRAGGSRSASELGGACTGYITGAPDVRLNYSAGTFPLIVFATASSDTTLVINGPDGSWYCDDDSGGNSNPRVRFGNPASGRYEIWVGTYSSGDSQPATLRFTERDAK